MTVIAGYPSNVIRRYRLRQVSDRRTLASPNGRPQRVGRKPSSCSAVGVSTGLSIGWTITSGIFVIGAKWPDEHRRLLLARRLGRRRRRTPLPIPMDISGGLNRQITIARELPDIW
jgi:hypothetical protein